MNKRANLLKHVKGVSGWRYYPVVWLQNGSVRPNYVLVNGKAEYHPEGFYSIEWYEQSRRRRQAVGKEASEAQAALDRHLHRLQGLALGIEVRQEARPKRSIGDACGEFLDFYRPSTGRKVKTYQAYRMALEQFQESCPKRYLEEIDRRDLQRFTAFLISKKRHHPRTAHNKLAVVAQFLKANNIPGLLKKGDWPSYVEREPEAYEPEELDKLFAACDLRNRVLFEFFLMTGMRDAEVRHTCWTDVSSRQFAKVKAKPEWHFTPKNWEEREVPLPDRLMESLRDYRQAMGRDPGSSSQPPLANLIGTSYARSSKSPGRLGLIAGPARQVRVIADKDRTANTGSCTSFGRPTRPCNCKATSTCARCRLSWDIKIWPPPCGT